jgi:AcrR family transcriptional regulator
MADKTIADAAPQRERMRGPERRARILAAAREVFLESGMTGARTRDIAERAGITEAFMFRIFDSKEHLYHEAVEVPVAEAYERLEREVVAASKSLRGLELFGRINELILEVMLETAALVVLAQFSEVDRGREFYRKMTLPHMRKVQRIASQAAGWKASTVGPEVALRALFAVPFGIALDHFLRGKPLDPKALADRVTQLYVKGIPHLA